jgi:phospholipid/cholesterol/gamma-HCH transport system permease protein
MTSVLDIKLTFRTSLWYGQIGREKVGMKTIFLPKILSVESISTVFKALNKEGKTEGVILDFSEVTECNQSGLFFLEFIQKNYPHVSFVNVDEKIEKMLAECTPVETPHERLRSKLSFSDYLETLGDRFLKTVQKVKTFFSLLADEIFHIYHYLRNRRGIYPGEIANQLFFMGYKSLAIVSLITFLVGVTISVTSAAQLQLFGADIYLAYFIGFAMVRELVPLMTGVILAWKIGAAVTAEISTMKVLEEIDALKTMGIVPVKFLMVPRLLAMTVTIPLLVAVADLVGIFGGVLVARFYWGTPVSAFLREMFDVVHLNDFFIGLLKTLIFGWTIVISSGFKGFSVQYGAEEVGKATTESVVLSVTLIIVIDCIFAFILY